MRELKFRLHDKEGKLIGFEYHKKNKFGCYQIYQESLRGDWKDITGLKLVIEGFFIAATKKCQYTGLKDKNGKEIYEGDIFLFSNSIKNVVVFKEGMFCYDSVGDEDLENLIPLSNYHFKWNEGLADRIEIIGNIHENTELCS